MKGLKVHMKGLLSGLIFGLSCIGLTVFATGITPQQVLTAVVCSVNPVVVGGTSQATAKDAAGASSRGVD